MQPAFTCSKLTKEPRSLLTMNKYMTAGNAFLENHLILLETKKMNFYDMNEFFTTTDILKWAILTLVFFFSKIIFRE